MPKLENGNNLVVKPKSKSIAKNGRPVIYERVSIKLHDGDRDPFLTVENAKQLLGWQEETPDNRFGSAYALIDGYGKKVRLLNNPSNRPYKPDNSFRVRQEVLRKHWRLNLESMIIGKTGICISCQHRLAGLVLAVQEWEQHKDEWPEWDVEPTMACLIAFGCDESDDVVNTIDTGIPRTLDDVIYRTGYFSKYSDGQREQASKILANAVKLMWERTGEVWNPWSPYRTHAESLAFIERFPRVIDCVNHIFVENGGSKKKISEYIPTGIAAGLLYIMGSCSTEESYNVGETAEPALDWKHWDNALAFWVNLASHAKALAPLWKALGQLSVEGSGGSKHEKMAVIVKAWQCIIDGEPLTAKMLALKYETDTNGIRTLAETPQLGGIDNPNRPTEPQDAEDSEEE